MALPTTQRTAAWIAAAAASVILGVAAVAATASRDRLPDVLDMPAQERDASQRRPATGVAASGRTVLAVGPRGLVMRSVDAGQSWAQVTAPVSADLTSVRFSANGTAWIVGHDSVILRSDDAGATWRRMLDGRELLKHLRAAAGANEHLKRGIEKAMAQSATPDVWPAALLDIAFVDARRGFAVGAFGLLLSTQDGGATWAPWLDRADNERQYHLYAVTAGEAGVFIAGEYGLLLQLDAAGQRFARMKSPYEGSFFGIAASGERLVVHGLRGNAFVSDDAGARWQRLETSTDANIVSASVDAGHLWLATQSGQILAAAGAATQMQPLASAPGSELYGAVQLKDGRFAVARMGGVSTLESPRQRN